MTQVMSVWKNTAAEFGARLIAPRIIKRIIKPVSQQPQNAKLGKVLIFIGGGHASGKSIIKSKVIDILGKSGHPPESITAFGSDMFSKAFKNPRAMKRRNRFVAFAKGVATGKNGLAHQVVNKVFERARGAAFAQGTPVIIDYHMDSPVLVDQVLKEAKSHGYETMFVAPHVRVDTIFERLETRKQQTGVPYDVQRVIESHEGFARNLTGYFKKFDSGFILDNDKDHAPQVPIVFSDAGRIQIVDAVSYAEVLKKADLSDTILPATIAPSQRPTPRTQRNLPSAEYR